MAAGWQERAKRNESAWEDAKAALAVLKERRAARGLGDFPALCAAIRGQVESALESIRASRAKREELAAGDCESLYFYPDSTLRAAFCDGAGLARFPA